MKRLLSFRALTWMLLSVMFFAGCQKEEETPGFEELSFDAEQVLAKLPDGLMNASDQYAKECVSFIESAVDMSSFIDNMIPPEDAQKASKKSTMSGDTWSWTWSYQGESFTFYWTYDEDDDKRYWSMDIQFGEGPICDYIDAWELKDGSQGEVVYNFNWVYISEYENMEDYEDLFWKYTWRTDDSGHYYFNWYYDSSDPGFDYYLHYDIVINPDGSGSIDYYSMDALFYHMEWDAAGNGSWAYYVGDSSMSGSWTAG